MHLVALVVGSACSEREPQFIAAGDGIAVERSATESTVSVVSGDGCRDGFVLARRGGAWVCAAMTAPPEDARIQELQDRLHMLEALVANTSTVGSTAALVPLPATWCVGTQSAACTRSFAGPLAMAAALSMVRTEGEGTLTVLLGPGRYLLDRTLDLSHPDGHRIELVPSAELGERVFESAADPVLALTNGQAIASLGGVELECLAPGTRGMHVSRGAAANVRTLTIRGCDVGLEISGAASVMQRGVGTLLHVTGRNPGQRAGLGMLVRGGSRAILDRTAEVQDVDLALRVEQASYVFCPNCEINNATVGVRGESGATVELGGTVAAESQAILLFASTLRATDLTATSQAATEYVVSLNAGSTGWLVRSSLESVMGHGIVANGSARAFLDNCEIHAANGVALEQSRGGRIAWNGPLLRNSTPLVEGERRASNPGTFCRKTDQPFTGNVGGYRAAKLACENACSSPTAHLCTADELVRSESLPVGTVPPFSEAGWYATGLRADVMNNGQVQINDCEGFRNADATIHNGAAWDGAGAQPNYSRCSTEYRLLCCD